MICRSFLLLLLTGLLVFHTAGESKAQQCGILPHTITDLRDPAFPTYSLWSHANGDKNLTDYLQAGVTEPEKGHLITAGERFWQDGNNIALVLQNLDRRGRIVWERAYGAMNFSNIVAMGKMRDGFFIVMNRQNSKTKRWSPWLGLFNWQGNLIKYHDMIMKKDRSIVANDVLHMPETGEFIMAASSVPTKDNDLKHFIFFKLNKAFQVSDTKALNIGLDNEVSSLAFLKDQGGVFGSGSVILENGRTAGWVIRLDKNGILSWQRQYARGKIAELTKVIPYGRDYVLALGRSKPYDLQTQSRAKTGAWVALIEQANGDILWERFYTDTDFNLIGQDMHLHKDGRVSVVINAMRHKDDGQEQMEIDSAIESESMKKNKQMQTEIEKAEKFTRLIVLNARGVVLESNSYFNGHGAKGNAIIQGKNKERMILGESNVPYHVPIHNLAPGNALENYKDIQAHQGWAMVADGLGPYNDPCVQGQ